MRKETKNSKHFPRKRVFLATLLSMMMAMSPMEVRSQIFLSDEDMGGNRTHISENEFQLIVPFQGHDGDQFVPLGGGCALLFGLGLAYGLSKRKKSDR